MHCNLKTARRRARRSVL